MIEKIAILVMTFLPFVACSSIRAQEKLTVDNKHLAGVVEAHFTSFEGWRSGDALVRVVSSGNGRYFRWDDNRDNNGPEDKLRIVEGPDSSSVVVQSDAVYRIVFDFDSEQCLVIGEVRDEFTIFNALDVPSPIVENRKSGAFLLEDSKKGAISLRQDGQLFRSRAVATVSNVLSASGLPDIRMLGWKQMFPWNCQKLQRDLGFFTQPDGILEIRHVGKDVYKLRRKTAVVGTVSDSQWDVRRNVPVRFWIGNARNGETASEGAAQWKLIDGLYVPVSSRYSTTNIKTLGTNNFQMANEVAVDIHWFSLNREVSDEFFEEDLLRDRKKLGEFLSQDVFETPSGDRSTDSER